MKEISAMSFQPSLLDLLNATSSPESECGLTPSGELVGLTISRFGRDRARASLSARQAKEKGLMTSGICGPLSSTSSSSASLQSSLESRLRAAVPAYGSILYKLTWKQWATPSGLSRFRLRASAARTSGIALSGWPTPLAADGRGRAGAALRKNGELPNCVELAGWATPAARDWQGAPDERWGTNARPLNEQVVYLAGWPTPTANPNEGSVEAKERRRSALKAKYGSATGNGMGISMIEAAQPNGEPMRLCSDGTLLTGSSAEMGSGGRLNPAHSRWLMRLPHAWDDCADTAMRSMPKSRRASSKR